VGWDLYGLLGIDKSDKPGMHRQHGRNYEFFGAPVALMFTISRTLRQGSWLDYGMFLQSVMVAARGRGLDTCPQAAFMRFHRIIMEHIGAPDSEMFVCGMSLGHADPDAVANRLVTEREPVSGFARFQRHERSACPGGRARCSTMSSNVCASTSSCSTTRPTSLVAGRADPHGCRASMAPSSPAPKPSMRSCSTPARSCARCARWRWATTTSTWPPAPHAACSSATRPTC
jgi:hypothetical protein